jgi:Tfp pilus assembly protein PilF
MRMLTAAGRCAGIIAATMALTVAAVVCSGCPREGGIPKLVTFSDPLSGEEHAQLGAVYEREGNVERAMQEYYAALRKEPENLVALTGLGNLSLDRGKPRLAARYYKQALELDPDNVVVLNNLAMAWITANKPEKALPYAERAVDLDHGKNPMILDTRAGARFFTGDREGAMEDLERAAGLCEALCSAEAGEEKPGQHPDLTSRGCDNIMAQACLQIRESHESIKSDKQP